jgi:hypothetical protein
VIIRSVGESKYPRVVSIFSSDRSQEAKYVKSWSSKTSAWAGWSRFDIPVDRYGGEYSLLICTIGFSTCHRASQQDITY